MILNEVVAGSFPLGRKVCKNFWFCVVLFDPWCRNFWFAV